MAKLSAAQLTDQLIELRAHCDQVETQRDSLEAENAALIAKIDELRTFAAKQVEAKIAYRNAANQHQKVLDSKPNPVQFTDYTSYCQSARAWCKAQGMKVIAFASREQFDAAHA